MPSEPSADRLHVDQLHVTVDGTGPAVVMTAGLGLCSFDWNPVVALLTASAPGTAERTVVRFDRPGLGSSPAGAPPTLEAEADRIAGLVGRLGLTAPIVVAHSVAAFHAEACALLHPGLLGGLVLVDPSCERPRRTRPRGSSPGLAAAARLTNVGGLAERLGPTLRTAVAARQSIHHRDVAPREEVRAAYGNGTALAAVLAEYASYSSMAARMASLRAESAALDLPVTVLTATGGMGAASARRWIRCHQDLAARSPRGRQRTAADSGHLMAVDRPDLIAEAVLELPPPCRPQGVG